MPCDPRAGKAIDLIDELVTAQTAITAFDRALLERAGVPRIIIDSGLVGAATILVHAGDLYEPMDVGARGFITPVRVADPFTPEAAEYAAVPQFGDLVDLVAWHPRRSNRWATRRGAAMWLGAITPQFCDPPPAPIRRTPLSWLRAGATGLCLLDRDSLGTYRVLSICRAIEAEDRAHRAELERALAHPFGLPEITVAAAPRHAGATHA